MIQTRAIDRTREGRFFIAMAVLMLLVAVVGFAPSTFLRPTPSERILFVHGAIAAAWMVLLIVQPLLIQAARVKQHRQLGTIGVGVAALVVIFGFWTALVAAGRPEGAALPAMGLRGVGMFGVNLLMFGILVGFAVAFRRDGASHKRLMLLATVNMLQAPIVRITDMVGLPLFAGAIKAHLFAYAFILPLAAWDAITRRRMHPATLWAGLAILLSLPIRYLMVGTETYGRVAQWLVDLV